MYLIPVKELVKTNTVVCEEGHIISDKCWKIIIDNYLLLNYTIQNKNGYIMDILWIYNEYVNVYVYGNEYIIKKNK